MAKIVKKLKEVTLNDLAELIRGNSAKTDSLEKQMKEGFDKMGSGAAKLENNILALNSDSYFLKHEQKIQGKVIFETTCGIDDLKKGQIKHSKEISELKDIVKGIFQIEMIDLKKQLAALKEESLKIKKEK